MSRTTPALTLFLAWIFWSAAPVRSDPEYCFPQAQAALAGVHLDTPMDSVILRLGQPTRRRTRGRTDEADGFQIIELTYPKLQVDIGRGRRVERLVTTSPGVRMPNGIQVGMTLTRVAAHLGLPDSLDALLTTTWTAPLCEGPLDIAAYTPEVVLAWTPAVGPFDAYRPANGTRRLARIEFASYGP